MVKKHKNEHLKEGEVGISHVSSLDEVLSRVAGIIDSDKDKDIAEALDCGPSTLSMWRVKNFMPCSNITRFCLSRGVSVEEVLTGTRLNEHQGAILYKNPQEALLAALDVQKELNLVFTADQTKAVLGLAYKTQSNKEQLKDIVSAAYAIADAPASYSSKK